jgi:hypothetical protein
MPDRPPRPASRSPTSRLACARSARGTSAAAGLACRARGRRAGPGPGRRRRQPGRCGPVRPGGGRAARCRRYAAAGDDPAQPPGSVEKPDDRLPRRTIPHGSRRRSADRYQGRLIQAGGRTRRAGTRRRRAWRTPSTGHAPHYRTCSRKRQVTSETSYRKPRTAGAGLTACRAPWQMAAGERAVGPGPGGARRLRADREPGLPAAVTRRASGRPAARGKDASAMRGLNSRFPRGVAGDRPLIYLPQARMAARRIA